MTLPCLYITDYRSEPIFYPGSLLKRTRHNRYNSYDDVVSAISELWPKGAEANLTALKAGYEAEEETVTA
jgi:hypothetical protein